jgi:hypothetical protein
VVAVPVTVSVLNIVKQVLGAVDSKAAPPDRIRYTLEGKLNSTGFGAHRLSSAGELELPASLAGPPPT